MDIINDKINLTLRNFIFENMTNEANNNLPIHEFDNDMKKLGFIKDYDRAGSRVIYKLKNGGLKITTHYPGKTAKADMLRNVFDNLIKIKWFDNPNNFNIFPFDRWGFNPNSINIDTTKQDILKANEIYQNAEVYRVFYNTPNKLCVLHTNEGYNLCRDINDKRPLLDKWYNGFEQGNVPKLKLDNYETMQTEVYPINQDGTLDTKNITLENKKLNIMLKKLIRLTESDLHRIIKESVNNMLNEEYWQGDINPKVMQQHTQDVRKNNFNEIQQGIDETIEIMRKYAKSGNLGQLEYYFEYLKTATKLIDRYNKESFNDKLK